MAFFNGKAIPGVKAHVLDGYTKGQVDLLESSKYMHPTVSGEVVRIDDMAAVPHKATISKRSKNFFNGNLLAQTQTVNGITVDNKGDNTFHFHGTATTTFTTSFMVTTIGVRIDPTKIYTIHAKLIAGAMSGITAMHPFIGIWDTPDGAVNYSNCTVNSSLAVGDTASTAWPNTVNAVKADAKYISKFWLFAHDIQQGATIDFTVQVWINESSTNLGYTPYMDDLESVKVKKFGKNLLDISTLPELNKNNVGHKILTVDIENNTFSLEVTMANYSNGVTMKAYLPVGTYRTSGEVTTVSGQKCGVLVRDEAGNFVVNNTGTSCNTVFTVKTPQTYSFTYYRPYSSPVGDIVTYSNIQLEVGNTTTEYEKYVEPVEVGETFDSTPSTITLMPDTSGVILNCQYCRDIDKYIDSLNVAVAMTGGA